MRFTSFVSVAAVFATLGAANPAPEPTDTAAATSVAGELLSYLRVVTTESAFINAATAITDPAALSTIESWGESVSSVIANSGTLSSDYLDVLPTEVRSLYSSIVAAEISIATKAGFDVPSPGQTGSPTESDNAAGPAQTAAVGLAAGLMGIMALL